MCAIHCDILLVFSSQSIDSWRQTLSLFYLFRWFTKIETKKWLERRKNSTVKKTRNGRYWNSDETCDAQIINVYWWVIKVMWLKCIDLCENLPSTHLNNLSQDQSGTAFSGSLWFSLSIRKTISKCRLYKLQNNLQTEWGTNKLIIKRY